MNAPFTLHAAGDWIPLDKQAPPEGVEVRAMDSGGHVQILKRRRNLFWFPDDSMYVYYTPKFWQLIAEAA